MPICLMQRKKKKTNKFEIGDLVYLKTHNPPKIAIIVKVKNLLKLYDILIQSDNVYIKDIHIEWLEKAI